MSRILTFILIAVIATVFGALTERAIYKETVRDCLKEVSQCEKYGYCDKEYTQWCFKEILKGE